MFPSKDILPVDKTCSTAEMHAGTLMVQNNHTMSTTTVGPVQDHFQHMLKMFSSTT